MKKSVLAIAIAAAIASMSGCSGLKVSWTATASYNATAVTQMEATHTGEDKRK